MSEAGLRRRTRWAIAAAWVLGVVGVGLIARAKGLTPIELADAFGSAIEGSWWGPAAFVIAYTLRPVVAFPGSVLTILAGVIFGPIWGTVWVIVGSNASTAVTYGAGRFIGGDDDSDRIPKLIMRQVERARDQPFLSTMVLRLLYLPFDPVGWVAGFTRLPFGRFLAGSAVGTVPGIVSFVGFGASLDAVGADEPSLDLRLLAFSIALALAGVGVSRWLTASSRLIVRPNEATESLT